MEVCKSSQGLAGDWVKLKIHHVKVQVIIAVSVVMF